MGERWVERGGDWLSERRDGTWFFKYGCHISRRTKRREEGRASEGTNANADMGCGKNRGSEMAKEGWKEGKGFSGGWLDIIHPPLWRSGDPELK